MQHYFEFYEEKLKLRRSKKYSLCSLPRRSLCVCAYDVRNEGPDIKYSIQTRVGITCSKDQSMVLGSSA